MPELKRVVVVGAGTMGSQIALQAALGGRYEVTLVDTVVEQLERASSSNRKLLDRTHRDGRMFITGTVLDGKFALRGCVTNFRSTLEDAQVCVETVVELGEALEAEPDAAGVCRGSAPRVARAGATGAIGTTSPV